MPDLPRSRAAFVIAGGKSSRMGTNKAFLQFGGKTLLDRALATLKSVFDEVVIVGDPAIFADFSLAIPDLFPGRGPLGGIHAALKHSSADLNLMLAVDMPFVTPEVLSFVLSIAAKTDATVTVPSAGKGLQPLCAVYRREFAKTAEENLRVGKYKIEASFSAIPLRIIDESELSAAGFSEKVFFNLNTPEDHASAEDFRSHPQTGC